MNDRLDILTTQHYEREIETLGAYNMLIEIMDSGF